MSQSTKVSLHWLETILLERFGHAFNLHQHGRTLQLTLFGVEGKIVFDQLQGVFHQSCSDFPCYQWQASSEGYAAPIDDVIPAPSEKKLSSPLIKLNKQVATVHYDILGLTYWMLTRLEEVGRTDLDSHQRFPATSSHAYRQNYLQRPIVDEWLNILGQVILQVWPQLALKNHKFNIKVSHDVDRPSQYSFCGWSGVVRAMTGDLINRGDVLSVLKAPWVRLNTKKCLHPADPANTFDWIMDVSEQNRLISAFYFICGRTNPLYDSDYEVEHPAIRDLMRRIHMRGHEIGIHPSYNTYKKPGNIINEMKRLCLVTEEEGIEQSYWGGRMHFLRWEHPTTIRAWDQAGMNYDSTLCYADLPGFRCGTCFEYPAFDPVENIQLNVRIRPLIVMECTVMAARYMGLGTGDKALATFLQLKNACRAVNGCFTLLWHNTELTTKSERKLYQSVLES